MSNPKESAPPATVIENVSARDVLDLSRANYHLERAQDQYVECLQRILAVHGEEWFPGDVWSMRPGSRDPNRVELALVRSKREPGAS